MENRQHPLLMREAVGLSEMSHSTVFFFNVEFKLGKLINESRDCHSTQKYPSPPQRQKNSYNSEHTFDYTRQSKISSEMS